MSRYHVVVSSTCNRAHRVKDLIDGEPTVCGLRIRSDTWRVLRSRGKILQCLKCYS